MTQLRFRSLFWLLLVATVGAIYTMSLLLKGILPLNLGVRLAVNSAVVSAVLGMSAGVFITIANRSLKSGLRFFVLIVLWSLVGALFGFSIGHFLFFQLSFLMRTGQHALSESFNAIGALMLLITFWFSGLVIGAVCGGICALRSYEFSGSQT